MQVTDTRHTTYRRAEQGRPGIPTGGVKSGSSAFGMLPTGAPPADGISKISWKVSFAYARYFPSGDHAGFAAPFGSCDTCATPLPSAFAVKICATPLPSGRTTCWQAAPGENDKPRSFGTL